VLSLLNLIKFSILFFIETLLFLRINMIEGSIDEDYYGLGSRVGWISY